MIETPEQFEKRKAAYKLCWHCDKKFYGNKKYEVEHPTAPDYKVFVHKQCKEQMEKK